MKTREQLLYEMAVTVHETVLAGTFNTTEKLLDLVINACEEITPRNLINEHNSEDFVNGWNQALDHLKTNLKKLKSK